MAQDIRAQSRKPNEQGQKYLNWKKTSEIKLSPKIIFKICVSKLYLESYKVLRKTALPLKQASRLHRNLCIFPPLLQKLFY